MLTVTILGSGTSIPWRGRAGPGWVGELDLPGRETFLVDPSAGSLQRLAERGISLDRLTHVLFSHYHLDHCGDLAPLLFALGQPRFRERESPLRLIGPRGLRKLLRDLQAAHGPALDPGDRVEAIELDGEESFTLLGNLEVTAHPVIHCESSVALRFSSREGKTLAYSGDTDRCDGAADAGRGADLFLLECTYPEGEKRAGHLVPSEAGRIAEAAGARRVVLVHLSPECRGQDLLGPCRAYYQGELLLAEDGMVLEV